MNKTDRSIIAEKIFRCNHYLLSENEKGFLDELQNLKFFLNKTEVVIQ